MVAARLRLIQQMGHLAATLNITVAGNEGQAKDYIHVFFSMHKKDTFFYKINCTVLYCRCQRSVQQAELRVLGLCGDNEDWARVARERGGHTRGHRGSKEVKAGQRGESI